MDARNPLRTLAPTVDADVLQVLARTQRAQDVGPAVQYHLNRGHVLAGPVLEVVAGTVDRWLVDRLSRWSPPAVAVLIFGSWARGEAGPESDLDLLLVRGEDVDPDGPWGDQVRSTGEELEALTGKPVQFVQVTTIQLATAVREGQPLIAGLRDDAPVLLGPDLRELLATGARA